MNHETEIAHYIFISPSSDLHVENNEDAQCCGGGCSAGECCAVASNDE